MRAVFDMSLYSLTDIFLIVIAFASVLLLFAWPLKSSGLLYLSLSSFSALLSSIAPSSLLPYSDMDRFPFLNAIV